MLGRKSLTHKYSKLPLSILARISNCLSLVDFFAPYKPPKLRQSEIGRKLDREKGVAQYAMVNFALVDLTCE